MRRCGVILLIFTFSFHLLWSMSLTGSLYSRYGQGRDGYRYFENLGSINLYQGKYHLYLQYEMSNPPEFGLSFTGIRKRWISYNDRLFNVTFGNIYTLWGRGLALNLFDDQSTDYDNTIDGVNFIYNLRDLSLNLIGGRGGIRNSFTSIPSERPNREETYTLYGGMLNFNISGLANLGFYYLWSESFSPFSYRTTTSSGLATVIDTLRIEHRLPGFMVDFSVGPMSLYLEAVKNYFRYRPEQVLYLYGEPDTLDFGGQNGTVSLYGSLNLDLPFASVMLDYKRYVFDVSDPEKHVDLAQRAGHMTPFQNPPIVQKEHEWTLSSRYLHIIDFNDEVGFQIEVQSSPFANVNLLLNYSKSSRNAAWIDTSSSYNTLYQRKDLPQKYLPSSKDLYRPFSEFIVGGDLYLEQLYFQLYYIQNREIEEVFSSPNKYVSFFKLERKTKNLPGEIELIKGTHSLSLKFEFQDYILYTMNQINRDTALVTNRFKNRVYNRLLQFTYSYSPYFSIGIIQEISSKNDPLSGNKKEWRGIELVWNITGSNQITLFLGSERGGLRCSSGICIPVPPIEKGARLTINSRF